MKNAVKYTDKGSIEFGYGIVETRHALPLLQFYVKDTGIGIPKDRQEAIFERFIQVDIVDVQARQGQVWVLALQRLLWKCWEGKSGLKANMGKVQHFILPFRIKLNSKKKMHGKVAGLVVVEQVIGL